VQSFRSGLGNYSSPQNGFFKGKVAMVLQGVWLHNFIQSHSQILKMDDVHDKTEKLKWGAAPFPSAVPGLENVAVAGYDCLVLPSEGKRTHKTIEFIKFMASHEGHELLCNGHRKISAMTKPTRAFLENHEHPYLKVFQDLAGSPNAQAAPQMGIWRAYERELKTAIEKITQNPDISVREVLTDVQTKVQKMLDRDLEERAERRRKRALKQRATR
jgi:multiple sugar transport system substrate-binding protein